MVVSFLEELAFCDTLQVHQEEVDLMEEEDWVVDLAWVLLVLHSHKLVVEVMVVYSPAAEVVLRNHLL